MSNEETITCWACDTSIPKSSIVCPNCEMPLGDSSEESGDIDSLLDDLTTKSTTSEQLLPDIPEFNLDPVEDQSQVEIAPSDEELPVIPTFDDDMPTIPDFDSESEMDDQMVVDETKPKDSMEPKIPDFEEEDFPTIPSFDDDGSLSIDDTVEDVKYVKGDTVSLSKLSNQQKLRIFGPQLTYWSLVFVVISIAGVKVENSNFNLEDFNRDHYSIKAELFLFGWISFLSMGWFYRYKLNQYNVDDKMSYGVIYLVLQLIYLGIVTVVLFLIVNPEAQLVSLSDTDTSITTIMSTYVYFSWLGFVITGLTSGFVLFFVGYRYYFNQIYNLTPLSKITN